MKSLRPRQANGLLKAMWLLNGRDPRGNLTRSPCSLPLSYDVSYCSLTSSCPRASDAGDCHLWLLCLLYQPALRATSMNIMEAEPTGDARSSPWASHRSVQTTLLTGWAGRGVAQSHYPSSSQSPQALDCWWLLGLSQWCTIGQCLHFSSWHALLIYLW